VFDRLREILFPLLVVAIVGSLWVVGRTQEMEEEIRLGVVPGTGRWSAVEQVAHLSAE
jgi:hypothetical protein